MGQKWQKLQIQDLLNKVYPKGQIFKMTLFSRGTEFVEAEFTEAELIESDFTETGTY